MRSVVKLDKTSYLYSRQTRNGRAGLRYEEHEWNIINYYYVNEEAI